MSSPSNWQPGSPPPPPPPSHPHGTGEGGGRVVLIVFGVLAGFSLLLCCGGIGAGLMFYIRLEREVTKAQLDVESQLAAAMAADDPWSGRWLNTSTRATYTIESPDGVPRVTSIVSNDGEVYLVEESNWDGSRLRGRFHAPSTGYTVEEELSPDGVGGLRGTYVSTAPNGEQSRGDDTWTRLEGPFNDGASAAPQEPTGVPEANAGTSLAAWEGRWLNTDSRATCNIYLEQGEPRLTQVVDDDGNLFPITGSSWDGRRMHWKYQDVVSGNTVEAEVRQFARDRLVGEWIATAADGTVNRGSHTWSRIEDDEP
jgi:hypothetical protein